MRMMFALPVALLLAATACKFPYPPDVVDDGGTVDGTSATCTPDTTTCADGTLTVCDSHGAPTSTTPCTFGCAPAGDRCGDLAPSNGLAMYLDQARTASPVVLTGDAVIDTDAPRVTVNGTPVPVQTAVVSSAPVDILVIIAKSFEVDNAVARGHRALAIVSDGDVLIHGTLSVSAAREVPGAGAAAANDPACTARNGVAAVGGTGGAGGGGHGTAGGRGGSGGTSQGGTAGAVVGVDTLLPLRGGCPGADAFAVPSAREEDEHPGGGGGAIQITSRARILLDAGAGITASGGGAKGDTEGPITPFCTDQVGAPPTCNVGAGGGAGGGILLEAAEVVVPASSKVVANGGAGHCGYAGYAADGTDSESAAPGSDCSMLGNTGSGGNGGAGGSPGFNGTNGTQVGGGGGGGAGRIRINLPVDVVFDPGPPIISPPPSLGNAATR
ncbi:MAG TPA: hypothetical protein VHE35_33320 [Kofleriaceae bacterium]|nr:hypothetical protein [Kofleriaceae bacterium]